MYVLYVLGKDKGPQKTIYKGKETNKYDRESDDGRLMMYVQDGNNSRVLSPLTNFQDRPFDILVSYNGVVWAWLMETNSALLTVNASPSSMPDAHTTPLYNARNSKSLTFRQF